MLKKFALLVALAAIAVGVYVAYSRMPQENGLGFYTTAEEAIRPGVDLEGKNVIVTGGYSGIGVPTVEVLAKLKANVWVPTRPSSMPTCHKVVEKIKQKTNNNNVYCDEMDLSSFASVKNFATKWGSDGKPLHILINNAGIMAHPFNLSVDGYELHFATNHLGHFLLTNLLLDNLKKGKPSRVVVVSSEAHLFNNIQFDDLTGRDTWYTGDSFVSQWFGPMKAYGQSKTANILFSNALNKKMSGFGTSNSLHPGGILTNLQKHMSFGDFLENGRYIIESLFFKTNSQGASTQLYLATAPELENVGGKYFDNCNIKEPATWATDIEAEKKLWKLSEEILAPYLKK